MGFDDWDRGTTKPALVRKSARDALVRKISTEPDPAKWLALARTACDRLGLDASRCLPLGSTLEHVCDSIVEEALKQGRSAGDLLAAVVDLDLGYGGGR